MGSNDVSFILLAILGGAVGLGIAIALIVVAVKVTGGLLSALGWLIKHVVRFVVHVLGDAIGLVGSAFAAVVAIPFATCNVVLGRWEAAGRWGRALRRETLHVGYRCYSLVLKRPLELLCLDGILLGVERRLPQGDAIVTPTDAILRDQAHDIDSELGGRASTPRRGPSEFAGYTIEGTLRPGGSGAKLYIASPDDALRRRLAITSEKVVIKSFALEEGSSLPQIVRESRALDAARALGLVFDHGLDGGRFWYAMPYHPGESLAEQARFLHARSGADGLRGDDLREAMHHGCDLVATLNRYHQGGLWHKDVKPDNIIVHDGRAHLVDLGLVTPLRSAMTLTTHGTEYFRDPEMVRQALRGVRVHQVDGARFDVYGAGAVLYFLLENTFPAHGGLSAFMKRSPEALRWIVRRAMADYHQRYATAQMMLDDLVAVAQSPDPWTLKPIELPSMRAADMNAVSPPVPPVAPVAGAAFGGAGVGAAAGWMGGAPAAAAVAIPVAHGRPRLMVTNWWSGNYASPDVAERVRSARTEAAQAALAARDAVKQHRREGRRASKEPKPEPPRLAALFGLLLPLTLLAVSLGLLMLDNRSGDSQLVTVTRSSLESAMAPRDLKAPTPSARLVLMNDHPSFTAPEITAMVDQVVGSYEQVGFKVVRDDQDIAAKLLLELAKARAATPDEPASSVEIDAALAAAGYEGALHVRAIEGAGSSIDRFRVEPIGSRLAALLGISGKSPSVGTKSRPASEPAPPEVPVPPTAPTSAAPAPAAPAADARSATDATMTTSSVCATLSDSRLRCGTDARPACRLASPRSLHGSSAHRDRDLMRSSACRISHRTSPHLARSRGSTLVAACVI
jgi:hypothetical protein